MLKFNKGKKIVTFGELLIRLSSPGYERLFQNKKLIPTFCGAEANVAVMLSNLGENVKFVSTLPNNDIGVSAIRELNYFGIDTSAIKLIGERMGLYFYENGASQRPSKVIYDRKNSSFSLSKLDNFDWQEIFLDTCWFHFTGINPAISPVINDICKIACYEAKKRGIIISCDINYRSTLWSKECAKKSMDELFKYVDICIGNEEDAEAVFGSCEDNYDFEKGIINNNKYTSIAEGISHKYGCRFCAFTLRSSISASYNKWSGMLYDYSTGLSNISDVYEIHIIDRVGSGDSFAASIIYSFINKYSNQKIIDFSVAASCLKHSIEGDFNRISKDEVEFLINTKGKGRILR